MGYFGTGISSNDQYMDTYHEFISLYNKGYEPNEITAHLIDLNKELINDVSNTSPDSFSFWYALAVAQWECKVTDTAVRTRVKYIIDHELDLQFWEGADRTRRKIALEKLWQKISSERPKAKSRKITKPPLFNKGDCLIIKLNNGNYGGIVILEALFEPENEVTSNLGAPTRLNMISKPELEDFINAEVLVTNYEFENDKQAFQQISWFYEYGQKKVKHLLELAGNIPVAYEYHPSKNYGYGMPSASFFEHISEAVPRQYHSEKIKPPYKHIKTIKQLTENKRWTYW